MHANANNDGMHTFNYSYMCNNKMKKFVTILQRKLEPSIFMEDNHEHYL